MIYATIRFNKKWYSYEMRQKSLTAMILYILYIDLLSNKQPTGSSLIKYCTDEEGCDLPDVQLIFNVSPIWYWLCSPLMCGPSLGKSIPLCMVLGIKRMGEKATCTEVE